MQIIVIGGPQNEELGVLNPINLKMSFVDIAAGLKTLLDQFFIIIPLQSRILLMVIIFRRTFEFGVHAHVHRHHHVHIQVVRKVRAFWGTLLISRTLLIGFCELLKVNCFELGWFRGFWAWYRIWLRVLVPDIFLLFFWIHFLLFLAFFGYLLQIFRFLTDTNSKKTGYRIKLVQHWTPQVNTLVILKGFLEYFLRRLNYFRCIWR